MDAHKPTILIVDDMPDNVSVLYESLKSEYEISAATDGKTAIEIAESDPAPDLILLDILMPGMNGYEICIHLKSNPKTEHIPIIFITALGEEEDETMGLTLGAIDYIVKPFKPDVVKARIRAQLELKQQRDRLALEAEIAQDAKTCNILPANRTDEAFSKITFIIETCNMLIKEAGDGNYDHLIPVLYKIRESAKQLLKLMNG